MYEYSTLLNRSILKSTLNPVEAKIIGEIPSWINGTLFRNGPGRYDFDSKIYQHLFDGQACVHKFKIENGKVFYSNRLLETKCYTKTLKEKRLFPNFGIIEDSMNPINRLINFYKQPETNDNVNINIVPFANEQLYALTETNRFCQIDPFSLQILRTVDIKKYISSTRTTIGHPHVEKDGSWITVGMNPIRLRPKYDVLSYRIKESNRAGMVCCESIKLINSIPSSQILALSYFHSFGITPNYIIFLEQPLILSYFRLFMSLVRNKPLVDCFVMKKKYFTRIHVVKKSTGEILKQKFVTDPQFSFHFINCYEQNYKDKEELIIDICSYDAEHFKLKDFTHENLYSGRLNETKALRSIARRIRVPLYLQVKSTDIYCEIKDLNEYPIELPAINYTKFNGLKYKYCYGASYYKRPFSIVKLNVEDENDVLEIKYFENGLLFIPSEPVFVERPNATSEDDGVLLVLVLAQNQNDYLSILDAKNLKEIARAVLPDGVSAALTFHGFWADNETYRKLN